MSDVQIYKAEGTHDTAFTIGVKCGDVYYTQTKHPSGDIGKVCKIDSQGRWGWDYWTGKFNVTEIDPDDDVPDRFDIPPSENTEVHEV